jgi:hypothetical protein
VANLTDVIPQPVRAFIGSALTIRSVGLVGFPFGAFIGVPLLIVGITLCVQGAMVPVAEGLTKTQKTAAEVLRTLGAIGLLFGCAMTSVLMVEHLVALKRGLSPVVVSGFWATLVACALALVLLTSGNLLRAKAPSNQTSLRAIYWLLHFPGSAAAVMFYAAVGMTLTA